MPARSKVEVKGLEAKFYDALMNLITLGKYEGFIRQAIADLQLTPEDVVMDLGAGTGKNAELMLRTMGNGGKVYALEIGPEMLEQLQQRQQNDSRIHILNQRIDEPFQLPEPATVAFISFVLHGFEQDDRIKIIENVRNNLTPNGRFCILDYNQFSVDDSPWYARFAIRKVECELAEDFINRDWPTILQEHGFQPDYEKLYFRNYVRLLCSRKA
jgi:demethylmenaquinone methyltransferase/2-methoxy-6-polyprenyl-1,4-benzoquinol methylase